jgi:hypothetical protein
MAAAAVGSCAATGLSSEVVTRNPAKRPARNQGSRRNEKLVARFLMGLLTSYDSEICRTGISHRCYSK